MGVRTELADGFETGKSGSDGHTGETHLSDRGLASVHVFPGPDTVKSSVDPDLFRKRRWQHPYSCLVIGVFGNVLPKGKSTATHVDNTVLSKLVQQALGDLPLALCSQYDIDS